MLDKPNDTLASVSTPTADKMPEIYMIINGEKFPRPGLETFFAETKPSSTTTHGCSCDPVAGVYCSCNKVNQCTCVPVCTCQAVCGCVGHQSGGSVRTGCRCAPVH